MKHLFILLMLVLRTPFCCTVVYAQDFQTQFEASFKKGDTVSISGILKRWEATYPGNAELYTAWFNYYIYRSTKHNVALLRDQGDDEAMVVTDSSGKTVAYLREENSYNPYWISMAHDIIDKGIKQYPNRLDMRFGKIYLLGATKDYSAFADNIVTAIVYNRNIKSAWKWTRGESMPDAEKYFLASIQSYIETLYNSGDAQLPQLRQVASKLLEYYPANVEALSDLSITYLLEGDNETALGYLIKAEKVSPKDVVVLSNIAETYTRMGDQDKAISYYNKIVSLGDVDEMADATNKLQHLKRKR